MCPERWARRAGPVAAPARPSSGLPVLRPLSVCSSPALPQPRPGSFPPGSSVGPTGAARRDLGSTRQPQGPGGNQRRVPDAQTRGRRPRQATGPGYGLRAVMGGMFSLPPSASFLPLTRRRLPAVRDGDRRLRSRPRASLPPRCTATRHITVHRRCWASVRLGLAPLQSLPCHRSAPVAGVPEMSLRVHDTHNATDIRPVAEAQILGADSLHCS